MTLLQDLTSRSVTSAPDNIAMTGAGQVLSYRQLHELANGFASAFYRAGLRPGDRVGIHARKSPTAVAAMLGVLRAGGVYVPVDPLSPPLQAAQIVSDSELRLLVASSALFTRLIDAGLPDRVTDVFLTDEGEAEPSPRRLTVHSFPAVRRCRADALPSNRYRPSPHDPAFILYTSGTTGIPKGVVVSHTNALAFVEWAADLVNLSADDRVLNVAPFHFDLSEFDIYGSLMRGATVVIGDELLPRSPGLLLELIKQHAITILYSVPSTLVLLLESDGMPTSRSASLRAVLFGGEVFPVGHLRRFMQMVPQARYFNLYGPTETNACLYYHLREAPGPGDVEIPIGEPCCGDQVSILDENGNSCAAGVIGELHVTGPTVMLGYWSRDGLLPPKTPYPTGDLVVQRADGHILFRGRRDNQVKIRGQRIELEGIEAVLHRDDRVREAVAVAANQQLVALVVPCKDDLSVLQVKQHCAAHLPPFMVPHEVRLVQSIPKRSNGKVDRAEIARSVVEPSRCRHFLGANLSVECRDE